MPLNFSSLFPPGRDIGITFDWIDVSTGTGWVTYDGWLTQLSGGDEYKLMASRDSAKLTSSIATASTVTGTLGHTTLTKVLDLDFDTSPFQAARTVAGDIYVRLGFLLTEVATGDFNTQAIIKVRKWDGTTETDILTITGEDNPVGSTNERGMTLTGTIPRTTFNNGDVVRITIEYWAANQGGAGTFTLRAYHDPLDDAGTGGTEGNSRLVVSLPFKVIN